jgi:hypothetical protein
MKKKSHNQFVDWLDNITWDVIFCFLFFFLLPNFVNIYSKIIHGKDKHAVYNY